MPRPYYAIGSVLALLCLTLMFAVTGASTFVGLAQAPDVPTVTFSETIAPILYDQCISCHRAGEVGPFPLISYQDATARGKLIAAATRERRMPPWHARGDGEFVGERRLTDEQIRLIGAWVDQGMPPGDPARMPPLPQFTDGWALGKPDLVLEMPVAFALPSGGHDVFRNFVLPTGLKEDAWLRAVELRPSARAAAHHALFAYTPAGTFSARGAVGLGFQLRGVGLGPPSLPSIRATSHSNPCRRSAIWRLQRGGAAPRGSAPWSCRRCLRSARPACW